MTKTKKAGDATAEQLEQPQTGGSFVRNADGSLTRMEHPPEDTPFGDIDASADGHTLDVSGAQGGSSTQTAEQ